MVELNHRINVFKMLKSRKKWILTQYQLLKYIISVLWLYNWQVKEVFLQQNRYELLYLQQFTHSNDAPAHSFRRRDYLVGFECSGHKISVYRVVVYDKRYTTYLLLCRKKITQSFFPFISFKTSLRVHTMTVDFWSIII